MPLHCVLRTPWSPLGRTLPAAARALREPSESCVQELRSLHFYCVKRQLVADARGCAAVTGRRTIFVMCRAKPIAQIGDHFSVHLCDYPRNTTAGSSVNTRHALMTLVANTIATTAAAVAHSATQ